MKRYEFDKLRTAMFAKHLSMLEVSAALGIGQPTLNRKLNGINPFTLDEMYKLMTILEITANDITIFFPNRKANKGVYLK